MDQDQGDKKFSVFAQKMVASIVGLWYNEAEVSGGMAVGCVIVITSGKGGTGKPLRGGAWGPPLALQGHKVLCIDGDVGLCNLTLPWA